MKAITAILPGLLAAPVLYAGDAPDVREIAIQRFNQGAPLTPLYAPAVHRLRVEPISKRTIRDHKLKEKGAAEGGSAVCVVIEEVNRPHDTLGGGTFYCIVNVKTGHIIKAWRSR